jgi:cytidylate kinase
MAIITISRGTYSGGKTLAECLGKTLGYRLLSREELVQATARRFGASQDELAAALSHKPGFLDRQRFTRRGYVACVQAELTSAVQGDNVVYQGQAGHLLLSKVPHHLRLKVVADTEYRIKAAMERANCTRDRAIQYIKQLDEARDAWVRWVYGVDRNDPATYDFVINLEHFPISSACQTVAEIVQRDFQTTPESQRMLDDLVVTSGIKARLAMDRTVPDDCLEIEAKDGVITITGTARSLDDAKKVRDLVHGIPGVRRVESRMETSP